MGNMLLESIRGFEALGIKQFQSIVGPGVHPDIHQFRRLTPIEASRLQGVPGGVFKEAGKPDKVAFKQLGNSVNVGVVRIASSALFQSAASPIPVDSSRLLMKGKKDFMEF